MLLVSVCRHGGILSCSVAASASRARGRYGLCAPLAMPSNTGLRGAGPVLVFNAEVDQRLTTANCEVPS